MRTRAIAFIPNAVSAVVFLFLVCNPSVSSAERHVRIKGRSFPVALAAASSVEPIVKLLSPLSGTALTNTATPFYNSSTEEILVTGIFTALDELKLKRKLLGIFVNNDNVPALVRFKKKIIVYQGRQYRSGTFAKNLRINRDKRWPMKSVTAEIVNVENNKVLARDRVSFYDLRDSADADPRAPLGTDIMGMSTQLSSKGLGDVNDPLALAGVEIAFLSALPQPSLADFNAEFTTQVQSIARRNEPGIEACINYADLTEGNFSNELEFGPFADALIWANADHVAYDTALDVCDTLPNPAAILACKATAFASFCVHSDPQANDFELCVDRLQGDAVEGSIAGVADASLRFLNSTAGVKARIESDVTLNGIQGQIEGRMRNLFVRWKNPVCVTRPRFSLDDNVIPTKQWLDSWTYCPNLQVNASAASTEAPGGLPAGYDIAPNPNELESLRATLNNDGALVPVAVSSNPNSGNCGMSFIVTDVGTLLSGFTAPLVNKLNSSWYSGPVNSPEARALTKIFGTYRFGGYDLPGHDIEISPIVLGSETDAGMSVFWDTQVTTPLATVLANQKQSFFFQPPGLAGFSVDAKDHLGNPFDISYNITTGIINRILNTRAGSGNLNFDFKPTWEELAVFGVPTPAGEVATDPATLNQSTMRKFDKAFKNIGSTPLEILVEPIFDPMVYMPPDVTAGIEIPNVGAPLAYGLENLSVIFKVKDTRVNGVKVKGAVLLRTHVSFLSKGFNFTIGNAIQDIYLRPHLDQAEWVGNVVTSKLKGCAMYAHYSGVGRNCERSLEDKIASLVRNRVEQSVTNFVSRIPAPKLFNALGDAVDPVEFEPQSTEQEGQNITFYGQLRRP